MKRNLIITGAGALVVAVALIGGSMAANNAQTAEAAQAEISVNGLKGGIGIGDNNSAIFSEDGIAATPGGDYEIERYAVNAGEQADYAAYFKVVIYKSWEDGKGEYIDIASTEDVVEDQVYVGEEKEVYEPGLEAGTIINGWMVAYADEEEIELFYTKPVPVGEATTPFINGVSFTQNLDNDYCDASYNLEFEVTAVQANNGEEAFGSALGLYPTLDSDGNIIALSEEKPEEE